MVINFSSLNKGVECLEDAFLEVNNTFSPTLLERIDEKSDSLTLADYIEKLLDKGDVFVYIVDQEIAGVLAVYTNDAVNSHAHIPILFVVERFKRRGIASSLLDFAINFAISLDMNILSVNTSPNNLPGLNLYHKACFERIQYSPDSITLIKKLK